MDASPGAQQHFQQADAIRRPAGARYRDDEVVGRHCFILVIPLSPNHSVMSHLGSKSGKPAAPSKGEPAPGSPLLGAAGSRHSNGDANNHSILLYLAVGRLYDKAGANKICRARSESDNAAPASRHNLAARETDRGIWSRPEFRRTGRWHGSRRVLDLSGRGPISARYARGIRPT